MRSSTLLSITCNNLFSEPKFLYKSQRMGLNSKAMQGINGFIQMLAKTKEMLAKVKVSYSTTKRPKGLLGLKLPTLIAISKDCLYLYIH